MAINENDALGFEDFAALDTFRTPPRSAEALEREQEIEAEQARRARAAYVTGETCGLSRAQAHRAAKRAAARVRSEA